MNPVATVFLEPLDVLFLRGNKLFGDPGSFGESLVPPWPSVAAGALRSRMLIDAGIDLTAFGRGEVNHPELGTPIAPGSFSVATFHLARRHGDGSVESLLQPPADLIIMENEVGKPSVLALSPTFCQGNNGLATSYPLKHLPVLTQTERQKPASGYWLTEAGWRAYLEGQIPQTSHLVHSSDLWKIDARVGVGLDGPTRRAADGRLFSGQAVAFETGVGFLAGIAGAIPPQNGTVRLGGDGRAAAVHPVKVNLPEPDYGKIAKTRRCRFVLTSPAIFPEGWMLPGMDTEGRFQVGGVKGRVVSAAVPRCEVVSGWDLAKWQPKDAQRVAPTGCVWWLDELEYTPETLRALVEYGLWKESGEDAARRAEGFNRVSIAAWK
jgi:CRISPR-associated protein Cmr3